MGNNTGAQHQGISERGKARLRTASGNDAVFELTNYVSYLLDTLFILQ